MARTALQARTESLAFLAIWARWALRERKANLGASARQAKWVRVGFQARSVMPG
jgi:hypothetical protein